MRVIHLGQVRRKKSERLGANSHLIRPPQNRLSLWPSCDLVKLRVRDITHGERVAGRAIIMQQKTQQPVQFEITEQVREAFDDALEIAEQTEV
jgi:hypothetical protein